MIEATPSRPYTGFGDDLLRVERNMRLRRKRILSVLKEGEIAPTVSMYPLLGVPNPNRVGHSVGGPVTKSEYISDEIINPHPRFACLTRNIRLRRGANVDIRVPLFRDSATPEFANISGDCDNCVWVYGDERPPQGRDFVFTGSGQSSTNQKWRVNVPPTAEEPEPQGLFYRSLPGVAVADADWPRNGDVVTGSAVLGGKWIKLQNGYYLPMLSEDGTTRFLEPVTASEVEENMMKTNDGMFNSPSPKLRPRSTSGSQIPSIDTIVEGDSDETPPPPPPCTEGVKPAIHADAMGFGMGMSCLQVTFQSQNLDESRFLYDQLAVLSPIVMALSASTPILRGRLADTDCRWGIISESVDDRTPAERGVAVEDDKDDDEFMAGGGRRRLYKSRYDSASTFLYQGACNPTGKDDNVDCGNPTSDCDGKAGIQNRVLNKYNDVPVPTDEDHYLKLRQNGCDPSLAQHIAHLFTRDPLTIFEGNVEEVDDSTSTLHFENIQSTNWQSVRVSCFCGGGRRPSFPLL